MPTPRLFTIKAYCTECGAFLMESNPMYSKELKANWDRAVLGAPGITCPNCKFPPPNFHIRLAIKHNGTGKEYDPKYYLPKPKVKYDSAEDLVMKTLKGDGQK